MTPTKPAATNGDVNEESLSPTSEVGSVQAQNVNGQITANDGWRALFEAQQTSMKLLVEALTKPPNLEDENITLPKFQPDDANTDARAWLATADICLSDREIQGSKLILILSKAMKGSAATWFSQIVFPNMKWVEFKEIFISRFVTLETCAATLLKMLSGKPQEGECLAAYASRLFTLLMSRWSNLEKEEMVVSLILAHMGQIEPRLQRNIFAEEITTRCKMQRELMAFSYRKRSYQEMTKAVASNTHDNKLPKLSSGSTKCYACGKLGHKSNECFSRSHEKQQTTPIFEHPDTAEGKRAPVTCYKCGVEGHVASRCSKTWSVASNSAQPTVAPSVVKRVNVCGMKPVTRIITQFVIVTAHNITLLEVPRYGDPYREANLKCHYANDKGDPPLHSVKWYRGNNEIFRYSPGQQPQTRTFNTTIAGVTRGSCNEHVCSISVVLPRTYNMRLSFTCEVSTERPRFAVVKQTKNLTVAVTLKDDPLVVGVPSSAQLGEDMELNCTTGPAMPPANIMWYIDGRPERTEPWMVNNTKVSGANDFGLRSSWRSLRLRVATARDYLHLRCEATQPTWPPYVRSTNATLMVASPHLSMFTASGTKSTLAEIFLLAASCTISIKCV